MLPHKLKRFTPLLAMLVFPVLGAMYELVNRPQERVYDVMTDLDYAIPFVKWFALPYSVWIFFIYACVVYFFLKDPKVYYRAMLTYTICALFCYMVYIVFQTTVPRPYLTGDDPFTRLMAFVYDRDQPYNCFPSIHCFSSFMVMRLLYRSDFRNRLNQTLIYGMSSLIIVSTVLVKQHAIMDIVAACLLVEIVLWGMLRVERTAGVPAVSMHAGKSYDA